MIKSLLWTALACAAIADGIAFAQETGSDPVIGTWLLNVSKSTFTSGPALKSQTRKYSKSGQAITLVMTSTGADGKENTTQTTYQLNGQDFPVTGTPDYDSISAKQVTQHTATFTLKRGGKTVGTSSRTVSKDGKTLTSKANLTTASGEKSESTLVFDKQ